MGELCGGPLAGRSRARRPACRRPEWNMTATCRRRRWATSCPWRSGAWRTCATGSDMGLPQYCEAFALNRVDGRKLMVIRASDLPKMSITLWDHIHHISHAIDAVSGRPAEACAPTMSTVHLPAKSSAVLAKFTRY